MQDKDQSQGGRQEKSGPGNFRDLNQETQRRTRDEWKRNNPEHVDKSNADVDKLIHDSGQKYHPDGRPA